MIAYETIVAAVGGEPVAMAEVLACFDGYIDALCTHAFVIGTGIVEYGVDTIMKTQLQGKLLHAMTKFKI